MSNMIYGVYKDQLVHVDQALNGIKCNCTCPSCGERLVARNKGRKQTHHYAHYFGTECATGYETSLHLLAKDILLKEKKILLPKYNLWNITITDEKIYNCKNVLLEKKVGNVIPDVYVITDENDTILIEIKVTHGIDIDKLKKIKLLDVSTIEIDLSQVNQNINQELLTRIIVEKSIYKKWIYHKSGRRLHNEIYPKAEVKEIVIRGFAWHVDNCPIQIRVFKNKSYANVNHDCIGCKFFIETFDYPKFKNEYHSPNAVKCFGHLKLESYENIGNQISTQNIISSTSNSNQVSENLDSNNSYGSLTQLWYRNNQKPFRAINHNGIQVQINKNPYSQLLKTGIIELEMFNSNGKSMGLRTVYGGKENNWKIKEKDNKIRRVY